MPTKEEVIEVLKKVWPNPSFSPWRWIHIFPYSIEFPFAINFGSINTKLFIVIFDPKDEFNFVTHGFLSVWFSLPLPYSSFTLLPPWEISGIAAHIVHSIILFLSCPTAKVGTHCLNSRNRQSPRFGG